MSVDFWPYQSALPPCAGKAQPGTVALLKYIMLRFPGVFSMGVYNCRESSGGGGMSIHSDGRAIDFGIPFLPGGVTNNPLGDAVVAFLCDFAYEFGLHGLIWDRVRYDDRSPRGRVYTGPHPHEDHIHGEQRAYEAATLTFEFYVQVAGPVGPGYGGEELVMQKGDKNAQVAELQRALRVNFSMDIGDWAPFPGRSLFDGRPLFGPGEDGDFGTHLEGLVKQVQRGLSLPQTGIVDGPLAAIIFGLYNSKPGPAGPKGDPGPKGAPGPAPKSAVFTY